MRVRWSGREILSQGMWSIGIKKHILLQRTYVEFMCRQGVAEL